MSIKSRYLKLFDELNVLFEKIEKKEKAKDDIIDFLIDAYFEGFISVRELLGFDYEIKTENLVENLKWEYEGITIEQKITDYLEQQNYDDLKRLVDSEIHRSYNKGANDYVVEVEENEGITLKKTWVTMGDEKVRDTHAYLEGITIDSNAHFVTFDGDMALFPGAFTKAQNNANCRCILIYSLE